MRRDEDMSCSRNEGDNEVRMFGSDEDVTTKVPTQAQSVVEGSGSLMVSEFKPSPDVDYLQVSLLKVGKLYLTTLKKKKSRCICLSGLKKK